MSDEVKQLIGFGLLFVVCLLVIRGTLAEQKPPKDHE